MNFIKKNLIKYKMFLSDMTLNMIGFAIYIASQQILLLPILAKSIDDVTYSSIVLYLSILNVICNVTGGELGNVRLVRNNDYRNKNLIGDFSRILVTISPIIALILFPVLIYLKYSVIGSVFLVLTILMANVRLYSTAYYRLEKKYYKVIIQNICYFVGIVISLVSFKILSNIYLLLFIPEVISIVYALKNSDLLSMKLAKTIEIKNTIVKYVKLGFISFLTNMMSYFDKFLIYPIFGAGLVAVYYAVNSISKIVSLITNPMSSVILSWVSSPSGESAKKKIIKLTLFANIPILIGVTIISIPLTYIALKILYSQYLQEAIVLIIPISITTAFGTAATLIKSVLLKYSDTNKLVGVYVLYFVIFAILGYSMSKIYGLVGFTIANLICRIVLWISFIFLLFISKENSKITEKVETIDN